MSDKSKDDEIDFSKPLTQERMEELLKAAGEELFGQQPGAAPA